jgi:hypothetical protein
MFDNKFKKNDPLADSVKKVMMENEVRRQVEASLNEELGIDSRKALPHEYQSHYDAMLADRINEALSEGAEGSIPKTPKERELAAKHGNPNRITKGDVLKARGVMGEDQVNTAGKSNAEPKTNASAPQKTTTLPPYKDKASGINLGGMTVAKKNMNEEQLDELKKSTLRSYIRKSREAEKGLMAAAWKARTRKKENELLKKADKRVLGQDSARQRLKGSVPVKMKYKGLEEENLNELSRKTLKSYMEKSKKSERDSLDKADRATSPKNEKKHLNAADKRSMGQYNARERLKGSVHVKMKYKGLEEDISFDSVMEEIAYNLNEKAAYVLENFSYEDQVAFFESLTEEQFSLIDESILSELYGAPTPGVGNAASQAAQYKSTMGGAAATKPPAARAADAAATKSYNASWNAAANRAQNSGNAPAMATPTAAGVKPSSSPIGGPGRSPSGPGPAKAVGSGGGDVLRGAAANPKPDENKMAQAGAQQPAGRKPQGSVNVAPKPKAAVPTPTPRPAVTGAASASGTPTVRTNFNKPGSTPVRLPGQTGNPNR